MGLLSAAGSTLLEELDEAREELGWSEPEVRPVRSPGERIR